MIDGKILKDSNLTPGESVAVALFADLYSKNPAVVKQLIESHENKFTGNPNIDFMQIAELSKQRKNFFDNDYRKAMAGIKYKNCHNFCDKTVSASRKLSGKNFLNFNVKKYLDSSMDVVNFYKTNGFPPEGWSITPSGILTDGKRFIGLNGDTPDQVQLLNDIALANSGGENRVPPEIQEQLENLTVTVAAPGPGPSGGDVSAGGTLSTAPSGNLDLMPAATQVQSLINAWQPNKNSASGKVLGMAKKTFYIVLGSVVAVIAIIVVIVMVRKHKKAKAAKAKA